MLDVDFKIKNNALYTRFINKTYKVKDNPEKWSRYAYFGINNIVYDYDADVIVKNMKSGDKIENKTFKELKQILKENGVVISDIEPYNTEISSILYSRYGIPRTWLDNINYKNPYKIIKEEKSDKMIKTDDIILSVQISRSRKYGIYYDMLKIIEITLTAKEIKEEKVINYK